MDIESIVEEFTNKLSTDTSYRLAQLTNTPKLSDQDTRRRVYLTRQKSLRDQQIDSRRGILEVVETVESEGIENEYKPSAYVPGFTNRKRDLSEELMLSEWMIERPEDFEDNWLALACPKGIRVLLVATKENTKTYYKGGRLHNCWKSKLPGGNRDHGENKKSCILDCVWCDSTQSIYVLDVLMWVNQTLTDCDLEFRDCWLRSKFTEYNTTEVVPNVNDYPIHLITKYKCNRESLNNFMSQWPPFPDNKPFIDGFLFYHREGHYVGGTTPLVVWLYPYMVNELLGSDINLHPNYNNMRPKTYTDQSSFIKDFEEKQAAKKKYKDKIARDLYFRYVNKNFAQSLSTDNGIVVFGSDDSTVSVSNESKKKNKRKYKNKKRNLNQSSEMEFDFNVSLESSGKSMVSDDSINEEGAKDKTDMLVETDSAVSSMEDSVLEENISNVIDEC